MRFLIVFAYIGLAACSQEPSAAVINAALEQSVHALPDSRDNLEILLIRKTDGKTEGHYFYYYTAEVRFPDGFRAHCLTELCMRYDPLGVTNNLEPQPPGTVVTFSGILEFERRESGWVPVHSHLPNVVSVSPSAPSASNPAPEGAQPAMALPAPDHEGRIGVPEAGPTLADARRSFAEFTRDIRPFVNYEIGAPTECHPEILNGERVVQCRVCSVSAYIRQGTPSPGGMQVMRQNFHMPFRRGASGIWTAVNPVQEGANIAIGPHYEVPGVAMLGPTDLARIGIYVVSVPGANWFATHPPENGSVTSSDAQLTARLSTPEAATLIRSRVGTCS
jgi:hypothetical protein